MRSCAKYRKGKTASELRYMGHTLTDNRHGLVVNAMVTQADGFAECEAAKVMIRDARQATASAATEVIRQHFALKRHLLRASLDRKQLAARFDAWRLFTGLTKNPSVAF